jgi:hypothetical protein
VRNYYMQFTESLPGAIPGVSAGGVDPRQPDLAHLRANMERERALRGAGPMGLAVGNMGGGPMGLAVGNMPPGSMMGAPPFMGGGERGHGCCARRGCVSSDSCGAPVAARAHALPCRYAAGWWRATGMLTGCLCRARVCVCVRVRLPQAPLA